MICVPALWQAPPCGTYASIMAFLAAISQTKEKTHRFLYDYETYQCFTDFRGSVWSFMTKQSVKFMLPICGTSGAIVATLSKAKCLKLYYLLGLFSWSYFDMPILFFSCVLTCCWLLVECQLLAMYFFVRLS